MNKPRLNIKQRALMSDLEDRMNWLERISGRLPEWVRLAAFKQVQKDLAKLGEGSDDDATALIRQSYVVDKEPRPRLLKKLDER